MLSRLLLMTIVSTSIAFSMPITFIPSKSADTICLKVVNLSSFDSLNICSSHRPTKTIITFNNIQKDSVMNGLLWNWCVSPDSTNIVLSIGRNDSAEYFIIHLDKYSFKKVFAFNNKRDGVFSPLPKYKIIWSNDSIVDLQKSCKIYKERTFIRLNVNTNELVK